MRSVDLSQGVQQLGLWKQLSAMSSEADITIGVTLSQNLEQEDLALEIRAVGLEKDLRWSVYGAWPIN